MATQHPELFVALNAAFEANEVRTRFQSGRTLSYITARTAMNRLDSVLGPENWWDDYLPGENSVLCRLTIRMPDGSTITKQDAGGYAGMADQGDDDKSGFSDAFKRAAVKFGVGRYLYRDGVPSFVQDRPTPPDPSEVPDDRRDPEPQARRGGGSDHRGRSKPQDQPEQRRNQDRNHSDQRSGGNGQHQGPPRTGRALFAWTKDQEQRHQVGLLKYLNGWGKLQDYPGRMVDWTSGQVALGHAEAERKLAAYFDESQEDPADRDVA